MMEEKISSLNIILIKGIDKERQIANFCYNLIGIGKKSVFPAYFEQLSQAVWKANITKWTWHEIVQGEY